MPVSPPGSAPAREHARVRARPPLDSSSTQTPIDLRRSAELAEQLDVRLAGGDLAGALDLAKELDPLLELAGVPGALAHQAKGELAAALGEPEAALSHFRAAGDRAPESLPEELPWRSGAALALLRSGETREAADLARAEVELATDSGSPYALAGALRTLAAVDTGTGRIQVLLRARAALADHPACRLSAQIATDLAGLLLLSPDPALRARARGLLREAEQQAGRLQLWPLQGRVRRLLDRLGEQPRRLESEAMAALTTSERRVARLAADGLTNKQIARELVVTVKAVEWHLSHIYRKLEIAGRGELPAALGSSA